LARARSNCLAGAGTPEEAGARRWLRAQGGAVKRASGSHSCADWEEESERLGGDPDGGRVPTLLANLPALTSFDLFMLAYNERRPCAAAVSAFLARAARAIGRCSSLQQLRLRAVLLSGETSAQLPDALPRELGRARTLEEVDLWFGVSGGSRPSWAANYSLAHLVAGLTTLSRLRALRLAVDYIRMEAALPASVSRLAQLTSLAPLRAEAGQGHQRIHAWERHHAVTRSKHALLELETRERWQARPAGRAAQVMKPGQAPSLRALPMLLWWLSQLCSIVHRLNKWNLLDVPRSELPVFCLPAGGAPCSASLSRLSLPGHNLPVFPPGICAMTRLMHLDLSPSCFEQLPGGVSALTALEELRLGRHAAGCQEIGGTLDARALGSLAGFPALRVLSFATCSVLLCPSFQAAAAHPCLQKLELDTSYPALGPSCGALLGFVIALLQKGRPGMLVLLDSAVDGAGRQDSRRFRTALKAVGFPLRDCSQCSLHDNKRDVCPADCHQDGDL